MAEPAGIQRGSSLPVATGVILGAIALLASWLSAGVFAVVASGLVGWAAVDLSGLISRGGIEVRRLHAGLAAAALPPAAFFWGQGGMSVAAGVVTALLLATFILSGPRKGTLVSMAASLFAVFYVGLLGSYPVLVRAMERGTSLLFAMLVMVSAYHFGRWLGLRFRTQPVMPSFRASPGWGSVLAGVGGCILGALVSTLFTGAELDLSGAAVIGILVGLAALLGDLASLMLRSELGVGERETSVPGYGGIVGPLATVLFAAPAFFYGLRFYVV